MPRQALPNKQGDPLYYDPKAFASAPPFLPGGLLNKLTARAFNEAWYRKANIRLVSCRKLRRFSSSRWGAGRNRIYGPAGFLQYQFAVPNEAAQLVPRTANIRKVEPSFLTVLKRFSHSNPAPLSFPIPGWTLAADVPAAVPGLMEVWINLMKVASAGEGCILQVGGNHQKFSVKHMHVLKPIRI